MAAFLNHILNIIGVRAEEKVVGVHTPPIVACVADVKARRDFTLVDGV